MLNDNISKKGTGFVQPLASHEHWHIDVSCLNIYGTFHFMRSVLDGCSRAIIHWQFGEQVQEIDIETIPQRAGEKHIDAKPRIITDNGPQFISRDFKDFIRVVGMTHDKTSPYYPQSNGKTERYHRTIKGECIRVTTILTIDDASRAVTNDVKHYNEVRLHSVIGYVTPHTKLAGQEKAVFGTRDTKLEAARETECCLSGML